MVKAHASKWNDLFLIIFWLLGKKKVYIIIAALSKKQNIILMEAGPFCVAFLFFNKVFYSYKN